MHVSKRSRKITKTLTNQFPRESPRIPGNTPRAGSPATLGSAGETGGNPGRGAQKAAPEQPPRTPANPRESPRITETEKDENILKACKNK